MRRLIALPLAAFLLPACSGGSGPASTPAGTFENLKQTIIAENWSGFVDFMPPSVLKQAEADWEKKAEDPEQQAGLKFMAAMLEMDPEEVSRMSFREFTAAMLEKSMEKAKASGKVPDDDLMALKSATLVKEEVDGDRCTITYKSGDKENQLLLVREEGKWYVGDRVGPEGGR